MYNALNLRNACGFDNTSVLSDNSSALPIRLVSALTSGSVMASITAVVKLVDPSGILGGMKAYSVDLRRKVLAAVDRGVSRAEVAEMFAVSLSTIKRLLRRRELEPDDGLEPKRRPGRHRSIQPAQHEGLWRQLESHREATIEAHTALYNESHGTELSQWTVGRAIRRLGWTRKKGRWEPPSETRRLASGIESG